MQIMTSMAASEYNSGNLQCINFGQMKIKRIMHVIRELHSLLSMVVELDDCDIRIQLKLHGHRNALLRKKKKKEWSLPSDGIESAEMRCETGIFRQNSGSQEAVALSIFFSRAATMVMPSHCRWCEFICILYTRICIFAMSERQNEQITTTIV